MGWYNVADGQVVASSHMNLAINQGNLVFDNAAQRDSILVAPSAPTEGMVSYLKDTDVFEKYNGTAWVPMNASTSSGPPVGSVISFAGSTAPTDWLLANGQAVSRTTYAALFAVCGTSYGIGNGTTTFNIPNLIGRAAVGFDTAQTEFKPLGKTGGAKVHTLTTAEIPPHSHALSPAISAFAESGGNDPTQGAGPRTYRTWGSTQTDGGGGGAHNNLQPYQVLNYIIKAL